MLHNKWNIRWQFRQYSLTKRDMLYDRSILMKPVVLLVIPGGSVCRYRRTLAFRAIPRLSESSASRSCAPALAAKSSNGKLLPSGVETVITPSNPEDPFTRSVISISSWRAAFAKRPRGCLSSKTSLTILVAILRSPARSAVRGSPKALTLSRLAAKPGAEPSHFIFSSMGTRRSLVEQLNPD